MNFKEIRQNLLNEALASPNLLSDLAGLEKYIAESYNNRSFIELLQNADDAESSRFKIIKHDDFLIVANNGKCFSNQDLESLCRSASSKKARGQTIGYRGIGFKSVVGFSKEVHLISGNLELTFSRELTKKEIPNAQEVPLIRIPHEIDSSIKSKLSNQIDSLKNKGYTTIFIFTGVTANQIESEYEVFKFTSLLFLNNISKIEFDLTKYSYAETSKKYINDKETQLSLNINGDLSEWLIKSHNSSSIAFSISDDVINKITKEEALIYAFLPTEDTSELGVIINGDYSTDPSRRHLIFDDSSKETIKELSHLYFETIKEALISKPNLMNPLIPYVDPRMIQYSRNSFLGYLLDELKINNTSFFANLRLPPKWLNPNDFLILSNNSLNNINKQNFEFDGLIPLLKYLGGKEIKFEDFKESINNSNISVLGCAQIAVYIFKKILFETNININEFSNLNFLVSNQKRVSINSIDDKVGLDETFINLLSQEGITSSDIRNVFKKFNKDIGIKDKSNFDLFESKDKTVEKDGLNKTSKSWFNHLKTETFKPTTSSVKRWRSAEERTLEILNKNGFNLEDVSKQNVGYDLGGLDPEGKEIQIEIKSITLPGQKFRLTNNEIAVAQVKQKSYYLAIIRQTDDFMEISLIQDPVNNLILNRQCVQWIWECDAYDYNPLKFPLQD